MAPVIANGTAGGSGVAGAWAEAEPGAFTEEDAAAVAPDLGFTVGGGGPWGECSWRAQIEATAIWAGHPASAAATWHGGWASDGWAASFAGEGGNSNGWLDGRAGGGGQGWPGPGDGWASGWWGAGSSTAAATAPFVPEAAGHATHAWRPTALSFSPSEEHTARVHFGKTYQVLSEVLEAHPAAFRGTGDFLDLGCAPGGFSCRLLEERPTAQGFGVTLPVEAGGFPVLLEHARLQVQGCNLMELRSPEELQCPGSVDVCLADAQDLGRRTNPYSQQRSNGRGGGGRKARGRGQGGTSAGVGAACTVLGIWALTLQELLLGLGRLRAGGTIFFRFGWRGRGHSEEPWYWEAAVRMLAVVVAHFEEVVPFKSEFSHQADSSFYVLASGFRREAYGDAGLAATLREAIDSVVVCQRASELPGCVEAMAGYATPDMQARVQELLDSVGRQRAIGLASRRHLESGGRANPEAAVWISPVTFDLTLQRIRERLERYGKIAHIRRRAHPVGVGADALVQFTQPAHAEAALQAITEMRVLGGNITARRLSDVQPS